MPTPGVASQPDRRFHRADLLVERRRLVSRLRRVVRWVVPVLAVAALATWGGQVALSSSLLRVRDVIVVGNERLSVQDIESLVTGLRDEHVLQVDFDDYRHRVQSSPWVADVHFSRELPATIRIAVTERRPVAVARLDQQLYLVDEGGSIIDGYSPQYREFDLPVVAGVISSPKIGPPLADPERMRLAASLLRQLSTRPDLLGRVSEVDVTNAHDAVVMFDDDATWVHLGEGQFVDRLQRYVDLRPTFIDRFGELDYVDLRFGKQVYVRGQDRNGVRRNASQ
jgi:cell division protein FtsQ